MNERKKICDRSGERREEERREGGILSKNFVWGCYSRISEEDMRGGVEGSVPARPDLWIYSSTLSGKRSWKTSRLTRIG